MTEANFKLKEICRVCLIRTKCFVTLLMTDSENITYKEKLRTVNNGQEPDSDIVPNCICLRCSEKLNFCYKFHKKCQKAYIIFTNRLKQVKNKNNSNNKIYITDIQKLDQTNILIDNLPQLNHSDLNVRNEFNFEIRIKEEPKLEPEKLDQSVLEPQNTVQKRSSDISLDSQLITLPPKRIRKPPIKLDPTPEIKRRGKNKPKKKNSKILEPVKMLDPVEIDQRNVVMATHTTGTRYIKTISPGIKINTTNCFKNTSKILKPVKMLDPLELDQKNESIDVAMETLLTDTTHTKTKFRSVKIDKSKLFYTCKICFKSFKDENALKIHTPEHVTECKICKQVLHDTKALKIHYNEHANEDKKNQELPPTEERLEYNSRNIIECNICNEKFTEKKLLILHMRQHFE